MNKTKTQHGKVADPDAITAPLDELGWVGIDPNDKALQALKENLTANNGIKGLELLDATEVDKAVALFQRDGFVVIKDALDKEQLAFLKAGCDREIHAMLSHDKERSGNRGSHRYSFGSANLTGHLMHCPEWAMLLDLPTVTPIVTAIFGSENYIARGGGGDFCLPGAVKYQPLHSDMSDRITYEVRGETRTHGSFHDPEGKLNYRDLPVPFVCCNFLTVDFTRLNGPTRQIPGTQNSQAPIPSLADEPEWMKLSTVCPASAGSVLIRDVRAWHGGTPNLSNQVRAIPNVEFLAPWFREPLRKSMPYEIYETLSDHGKRIAEYIVAHPGEKLVTGYHTSLGLTPPGFH